MNIAAEPPPVHPRLRLWPGIAAVLLQWGLWLAVPAVFPAASLYSFIGALACVLVVLAWWFAFARIPRLERWAAVPLIILFAILTRRLLLHQSIAGAAMGFFFYIYFLPTVCLALVAWAAVAARWPPARRRISLAAAIFIACAAFALLRTDGMTGEGGAQLAWRWSKTAEQQLLARTPAEKTIAVPAPPTAAPAPPLDKDKLPARQTVSTALPAPVAEPVNWPGFRGHGRDGVVAGLPLNSDWNLSKPLELWRRPVGPGWSSFAVGKDLLYTQEQRGEFEMVSCYSLSTGQPVWSHRDTTRFWESNGGAGPRGTPTLHDGRIYALGATGVVNALDARTGAVIWTRNAASDTGATVPTWGFSGSPLVFKDNLIVAASGHLAAYDLGTGNLRWVRKDEGGSYSSPHLMNVEGVPQVVLLTSRGAASVDPSTGNVFWNHTWEGGAIVQPALIAGSGVLITTADASGGLGVRRLAVHMGSGGWDVQEAWTSRGLKPYFNDFVVHEGHAFGFDGSILSCIDLRDGTRKWKGGRYGHGQMVLVRDRSLLLILSEEGEIALVKAAPDQYAELARIPALEGKTWNHPAVAGDVLLIRNGQEMAAYRLPVADGRASPKTE